MAKKTRVIRVSEKYIERVLKPKQKEIEMKIGKPISMIQLTEVLSDKPIFINKRKKVRGRPKMKRSPFEFIEL